MLAPASSAQNRMFPGKGNKADWETANKCQKQADELADAGKLDAAILKSKAAQALYPYEARFPFRIAMVLCKKKEFQKSIPFFKASITLDPNYYWPYYNLGVVYGKLKLLNEAERAFRKAQALDPASFEATFNLGAVLVDLKRFKEAREQFLRSAALPKSLPERVKAALAETEEKEKLLGLGKH